MATSLKNLSDYNPDDIPSGEGLRIGIVLSEWNHEITNALLEGAVSTLLKHGVKEEHIKIESLIFLARQVGAKGFPALWGLAFFLQYFRLPLYS